MRPFVLIIGVGLLAARVAHAADCPATPYFPNPSDIDTHVFLLDDGYIPVAVGLSRAKTPSCTTLDPNNGGAIKTAFTLAPAGLKTDLCNLKCIAVFNGGGSWGKWANNKDPKYNGDGSAVIGVGTNDLNIKLSQKLDNNLIGVPGSHSVTAGNDTPALSLMYTLAHEMAHIKWRRDFANGINANCPVDTFIGTSWKGHAGSKARRWTYFGDEFGDIKNNNIRFPSQVMNEDDVYTIYTASPGAFATALGATNPEEDFVESYAIGAILVGNNGTATTTLKLPTINKSILVDDPNYRGNNVDLKTKINQCALPVLQSAMIGDGQGGYGKK